MEEGKTPLVASTPAATREDPRYHFLGRSAEGVSAGRDLQEKLLIQDSIAHFDKAVALDPNFALAELNRSAVSPTGKEFFDHLKKAVSLSDKASNGERLLILATEAEQMPMPRNRKSCWINWSPLIQTMSGPLQPGWLLFRATRLSESYRTLQEGNRTGSHLLDSFNILGYAYRRMLTTRTPSRRSRNT